MCDRALDELEGDYRRLVIGNQGKNLSVGTNVFIVVMAAENKQRDVIEGAIKTMQDQILQASLFTQARGGCPLWYDLWGRYGDLFGRRPNLRVGIKTKKGDEKITNSDDF